MFITKVMNSNNKYKYSFILLIVILALIALFNNKTLIYKSNFEYNTNKPIHIDNKFLFVNELGDIKTIKKVLFNFYIETFIENPTKDLKVLNSGIVFKDNLYFLGSTHKRNTDKNKINDLIVISKFDLKSKSFIKQKKIDATSLMNNDAHIGTTVASRSQPIIYKNNIYFAFGHIFYEPQENFSGYILKINTGLDDNSESVFLTSPSKKGGGVWGFESIKLHSNYIYVNSGNCYGNFYIHLENGGDSLCSSVGKINPQNMQLEKYYTPPFFTFLDDSDIDICVGPIILAEDLLLSLDKGGVVYLYNNEMEPIITVKLPNERIQCTSPHISYNPVNQMLDIIYAADNDHGIFHATLDIDKPESLEIVKIYSNNKSYFNSKIYKNKKKSVVYFIECIDEICSISFLNHENKKYKSIKIAGKNRVFNDNLIEIDDMIISSSISKIEFFKFPNF